MCYHYIRKNESITQPGVQHQLPVRVSQTLGTSVYDALGKSHYSEGQSGIGNLGLTMREPQTTEHPVSKN